MPTIDDARRLSAGMDELVRRARADLDTIWGRLDLTNYKLAEAALTETIQAVADKYGSIGATVTADWYDQMRYDNDVTGRFFALAQDTAPASQIESITSYAVNQGLWKQNPGATFTILNAALDRLIKQPGRQTLLESTRRDPARPRYARVPMGLNPCAFCRMLASRGYVYATRETAWRSGDGYHGDCHCQPIPQWGPGSIDGYDYQPYLADYNNAGGDLAKMRKGTEENAHHDNATRSSSTGGGAGKPPAPPSILLGGADDWPEWLNPMSGDRWQHINDEHGPDANNNKPHFNADTHIANAIFDTITKGTLTRDTKSEKEWRLTVNGQTIVVKARHGNNGWFIVTAYPDE